MEQLDQRRCAAATPSRVAARGRLRRRRRSSSWRAGAVVVGLRIANDGAEPEGQNWWLVAWFVVGLGVRRRRRRAARHGPGAALLGAALRRRRRRRPSLTAVAIQYARLPPAEHGGRLGVARRRRRRGPGRSPPACSPALVPWLLRPGARATGAGGVGRSAWPLRRSRSSSPPRRPTVGRPARASPRRGSSPRRRRRPSSLLGVRWWRQRGVAGDPLPGVARSPAPSPPGWPSCPASVDVAEWTLAGARRRVGRCCSLATVPLLVGGAVVDAHPRQPVALPRRRPTGSLEWACWPAASSSCTPGSSPASAGSSAAAARRGCSSPRPAPSPSPSNRPAAASAGSSTGSCTAPATTRSPSSSASSTTSAPTPATTCCRRSSTACSDELRLDAVAIDLRVADGWQPGRGDRTADRATGASSPLRHRGEVVGRLVVGWERRAVAARARRGDPRPARRPAQPRRRLGARWPPTCAARASPSCRRGRRSGAGCAATSTTGSVRR